ncbi:MAG: O-antigen ligase protein [Acidimicrobiales bacterium]|nr:O-antigen ligase protein [Acidimicrobiales bacterium]
MPLWLVTGLMISVIAFILKAPLRYSLVAFLAVVVLLPAGMVFPNALSALPTIGRVATIGLGLRLVVALRRGEASSDVMRPTLVHGAFCVFLCVALVNGVLLASPAASTPMLRWLGLVDQFLAFALTLAVARALDDSYWIARVLALLFGVSVLIAILEHITGVSWGRLLLEHLPGQRDILGAGPLERRAGGVRVRAAAEFALEFSWIMAMALPVAAVIAIRSRHWLVRLLPAAVVLAIYWSGSRSALWGIVLTLVLVAVTAGDRRTAAILAMCLALGLSVWILVPSTRASYRAANLTGSTLVRQERLPAITGILTTHPYGGLGLGGLVPLGFPTTDATFLLVYAELGVVGLAAFAGLLLILLLHCSPGLRAPPSWERLLGSAVLAALVAGLLGAASFDLFSILTSARLFWVLAALGVLLGEKAGDRVPLRGSWKLRVAAVPTAVVLGTVLRVAVPSHAAVVTPFDSVPTLHTVFGGSDEVFIGKIYFNTVCSAAEHLYLPGHANLTCINPHRPPGFGELRVDAPTLSGARRATETVTATLRGRSGYRPYASSPTVGRPTWARTAPLWLGTGALLIALGAPPLSWNRRQLRASPARTGIPAGLGS